MRILRVFSIFILVAVIAVIGYAGFQKNGPDQFEAAFNQGGKIALDLSAGGYEIRGTTDNKIKVEIDPGETREVHTTVNVSGTTAKVTVEGPSNNFHATIYVPQRSDLQIDQTVGELIVSNVEGNKNAALGIGRMQLEATSGPQLPSFDGTVLLGALKANAWHIEKGGFFRGYDTRSSSPYSIKAHVDIGDLEVIDVSPRLSDSHSQKSGHADNNVSDEDSDDDSQ